MKFRLIAFLGVFGLTLITAIIGNLLEAKGILTRGMLGEDTLTVVKIFFFGLFCLLCMTLVPLVLHFFIAGQAAIGNGDFCVVRWLRRYEIQIVLVLECLFLAGLVLISILGRQAFLSIFQSELR